MSTKMYNYRLPKEQWWSFARACRRFYLDNHPLVEALKNIMASETDNRARYSSTTRLVDSLIDAGWAVELQVFDEGDTVLVRPLERGYFFMNSSEQWTPFGIERVSYDDRGDVPPEDEKNRPVAEWVDQRIDAGDYLLFNVLNRDDFMTLCVDQLLSQRKERVV